jgi:TRAP-type C4-dicarboxylate transport system substrate-binding protein
MHSIPLHRRAFAAAAGAVCLGGLFGTAPAAAQTKWNLPGAYAPNNYHSENLGWFAAEVRRLTDGKLDITVHPGASLFKAPEIKRAVATGQAQLGEILLSLHENEDPVFGLDTIPFLTADFADARKLWEASKAAVVRKLDQQGLTVLYSAPWPSQGLYAKKELNSLDDLEGLKMRVYNVGTSRIAELTGAQGVTVQAAELPQAVATGTVNAFTTSGITGVDTKAWETVSHFGDLEAWQPKNLVIVNKAAFNGLPKDQQEAIEKAAAAAEERAWKLGAEKQSSALDTLKEKGIKVLPPSEALRNGFRKIGEQLIADWQKRAGPDGQAVLASYRK